MSEAVRVRRSHLQDLTVPFPRARSHLYFTCWLKCA